MGISQVELQSILDYDPLTGKLTWINPKFTNHIKDGDEAGTITVYGYRIIIIDKVKYQAHRLVWLYVYGVEPKYIDHRDHDRDNNRLSNLRSVSWQENRENLSMYKSNKSGHMCIHYEKSRSKYAVAVKGKYIGRYKTIDEAIEARDKAWIDAGMHINHGK